MITTWPVVCSEQVVILQARAEQAAGGVQSLREEPEAAAQADRAGQEIRCECIMDTSLHYYLIFIVYSLVTIYEIQNDTHTFTRQTCILHRSITRRFSIARLREEFEAAAQDKKYDVNVISMYHRYISSLFFLQLKILCS